jgi:hypothetical protein
VGFEIQTNKKWLQISVQLQDKLQTAMESIQIFYSHSKILVLNEQNIESQTTDHIGELSPA